MTMPGEVSDHAAAMRQAELVVERLTGDYLVRAAADLDRLEIALRDVARCQPGAVAVALSIAHDIKGQGGTFGFPLVTAIAELLFSYLKSRAGAEACDAAVAAAHLKALRTIVQNRIPGDGGPLGAAVLAELAARAAAS